MSAATSPDLSLIETAVRELAGVLRNIVKGKYRFAALKAPKLHALGLTRSVDVFDCDDLTEAGRKAAAEASGQTEGVGRRGSVELVTPTTTGAKVTNKRLIRAILDCPRETVKDLAAALEPLLDPCELTVSPDGLQQTCDPFTPYHISTITPLEGTIAAAA